MEIINWYFYYYKYGLRNLPWLLSLLTYFQIPTFSLEIPNFSLEIPTFSLKIPTFSLEIPTFYLRSRPFKGDPNLFIRETSLHWRPQIFIGVPIKNSIKVSIEKLGVSNKKLVVSRSIRWTWWGLYAENNRVFVEKLGVFKENLGSLMKSLESSMKI